MCTLAAAVVGMMVAGAVTQSQGAGQQAEVAKDNAQQQQASLSYQAKVSDNNAQIAEWQAQDAIRQGQVQEQNLRLGSAQTRSTQRVAMAANGITLDSDTAIDTLTTTDYMTEHDASTIRDNARRTAWGYQVQKTSFTDDAASQRYSADRAGANAASISPSRAVATSLIGSAAQAAPALYGMYNGAGASLNSAGSGVTLNGLRYK